MKELKTPKIWSDINNITPDRLIVEIYKRQIASSKHRGHPNPTYSLEWLKGWVLSQPNFQKLFDEWVLGGCKTPNIPSVDRLDDALPYMETNLNAVMTWAENKRRGELLRKEGISKHPRYYEVHQFDLQGNYIQTFHSSLNACQALGEPAGKTSHILQVCRGERNKALGYTWSFDKEGRDNIFKLQYRRSQSKSIAVCAFMGEEYLEFQSSNYAETKIPNVKQANIKKVISGTRHTCGGYKWKILHTYIQEILSDIEDIKYQSNTKDSFIFNEDTCLVTTYK